MAGQSESAVLEAAIRAHRDAIQASEKLDGYPWQKATHAIDQRLWSHIGEDEG